jgi:hypothetical protein
MEYKIKITTGFSEDEKFTIEPKEAHKAYYLFNNPTKRGTFSNGVAVTGNQIRSIQPDYHATMGWNPSHKLDDDDWNEIRGKGVDNKLRNILSIARDVAKLAEQDNLLLEKPLNEIKKEKTNNTVWGRYKSFSR